MAPKKVDFQKIQSLKAKWLDKLREMDKHNAAIQQLQQEVMQLQKEVEEEESKKI